VYKQTLCFFRLFLPVAEEKVRRDTHVYLLGAVQIYRCIDAK
jgi:hypothetical protein